MTENINFMEIYKDETINRLRESPKSFNTLYWDHCRAEEEKFLDRIAWLKEEGFIEYANRKYALTDKALELIKAVEEDTEE